MLRTRQARLIAVIHSESLHSWRGVNDFLFPAKYRRKKKSHLASMIGGENSTSRESVDLDTMGSMSLKPLSMRASRSRTRCRLANTRIDTCESDLLLLPGWQDVIMRFLEAITHLSTLREAKFCESHLKNTIEGSMEVNEIRSWRGKRYAKEF